MTVYIVQGQTGEYSDRRDWIVKGFLAKEKAEALVDSLETWLRENHCHYNDEYAGARIPYHDLRELGCPLDPHFDCDYTGSRYYMYEIEVEE